MSREDPFGGENGNPLQNSYLENPMERGAWRATVHGVTQSGTTGQLRTAHKQRVNTRGQEAKVLPWGVQLHGANGGLQKQ